MKGKKHIKAAADLLKYPNVPVSEAAEVLAREPGSPVTRALKLWVTMRTRSST
jgi:hypothetical protein